MRISNSSGDDKLIDLHAALPDRPPWQHLSGLISPAEYLMTIEKINTVFSKMRGRCHWLNPSNAQRPPFHWIFRISLIITA